MAYQDLFGQAPVNSWAPKPSAIRQFPYAQTTRNQPLRRTPADVFGGTAASTQQRNLAPVAPRSASVYQDLIPPPVAVNTPVNMAGFMTPIQSQYPTQNFNVFNPDTVGGNTPMSFGSGMTGETSASGWPSFSDLLAKGKEGWNNNKDWLVGDKENFGLLPVGLGLFNAFNQYSAGKAGIKAMKEQNALAREAFNLNKTGMLSDYETQVEKRARQDYLTRNPNATPAEIYAAAAPVTEERMKRFK